MNAISLCIGIAAASMLVPSIASAQPSGATETAVVAVTSPTASVAVAGLSLASIQALPHFPVAGYREGYRQGRVVVGYQVNADGTVSDVEVLDAYPVQVFTRTATGAVANWRFTPTGTSERRIVEFRFERE